MSSKTYLKSKLMTEKKKVNSNLKQMIISIIIGAAVTFLATIFESLAELLKSHSTEIVSGVTATGVYLAKAYRG